MKSYVVYDENIQGKRPAVLVVHEWWGLNDYTKRRARMLAEMGYIAMAVDMYGNDRMGNDPGAPKTCNAISISILKWQKNILMQQWKNLKKSKC